MKENWSVKVEGEILILGYEHEWKEGHRWKNEEMERKKGQRWR